MVLRTTHMLVLSTKVKPFSFISKQSLLKGENVLIVEGIMSSSMVLFDANSTIFPLVVNLATCHCRFNATAVRVAGGMAI